MSTSRENFDKAYLVGGSLLLSACWLLPNHHLPWVAFHSDAWAAIALSLAAAAIVLRNSTPIRWNALTLLVALFILIPPIQNMAGIIRFSGDAWICSAYLIGFLIAIITAESWENSNPSHPGDYLFLAIGFAALASVGIQLYQWLGLNSDRTEIDVWVHVFAGSRPSANFGQPNQLATLLIWGILATGWGVARGKLSGLSATLTILYLLTGLALTQSRTSWIVIVLFVAVAWIYRNIWPSKKAPVLISILGAIFFILSLNIHHLAELLLLPAGSTPDLAARTAAEVRPAAWVMFAEAAMREPFFGYGWNQVVSAQLSSTEIPSGVIGLTFSHSHNIFLDIALWAGIPAGAVALVVIALWTIRTIARIAQVTDLLLLLLILSVGVHAMLELPLHYAYFLLPTGMAIGALNSSISPFGTIAQSSRWSFAIVFAGAVALLSAIVIDYLKIEENFFSLRFESARIGTLPPAQTPDVLVINQLSENLRFARFEPHRNMSDSALEWSETVALNYPSLSNLVKVATALALNERPKDAERWMKITCKVVSKLQCFAAIQSWKTLGQDYPEVALLVWPTHPYSDEINEINGVTRH